MFKCIKQVNLKPLLDVLDKLQFIWANPGGGSDGKKYPCYVVLPEMLPKEINIFIESLNLGGRTARAVIRKLLPKQSIPPHIDDWVPKDVNWRRFQVPLISDPNIIMRWPEDNVELYLEPGWLYEVRIDKLHEVVNNSDKERLHLQIDQIDATI